MLFNSSTVEVAECVILNVIFNSSTVEVAECVIQQ